jgi:hypothetical protein
MPNIADGSPVLPAIVGLVIGRAFRSGLTAAREQTVRRLHAARAGGELPSSVDPELVLDLLMGAVYYRLILKDRLTDPTEVGPMVAAVLAGLAATG